MGQLVTIEWALTGPGHQEWAPFWQCFKSKIVPFVSYSCEMSLFGMSGNSFQFLPYTEPLFTKRWHKWDSPVAAVAENGAHSRGPGPAQAQQKSQDVTNLSQASAMIYIDIGTRNTEMHRASGPVGSWFSGGISG